MSSDIMVMAGLGRPFTLGMLYDARREKLIPGFSLFGDETLQQYATSTPQRSSEFQIVASDSVESKSNLMDIEASLGVSFLGGLVEVGGSAKYLNNTKKYQNQSRVTLKYKVTTTYQQFKAPPGKVNVQQTAISDKNVATHVVTAILFGANAFFVFDSDKLEDSNLQDIQGKMEAAIKKIPTVTIEGSGSVQLTDEEKSLTSNLSCKFHGDFLLESLPTTFEDAVTTYKTLPELLGEEATDAVPMKVWLVPLRKFYSQADLLVRDISQGIVRKVQSILEDLHEQRRRCNEAIDDRLVKQLPLIHDRVSNFQQLFQDYILTVQQTIAKKLPLIRDGTEEESSLEEITEDRANSPFSNENVNIWLDNIETEIGSLKACAGILEKTQTKFVSNQTELDREVLAENVKHALCFVFTYMERNDPYLRVLAQYLESPDAEIPGNVAPSVENNSRMVIKMKQKALDFSEFAKKLEKSRNVHFLAAAITNGKYQGASIYHYKEGSLVTEDFTFPPMAPAKTIKDRSDLLWYACDLTFDPNTAHQVLALSDDNKYVESGKQQNYSKHPERFENHRQVLCKEPLRRRHYWEVEWNGFVIVGVTYSSVGRKNLDIQSVIGFNETSWTLMSFPRNGFFVKGADMSPVRIGLPDPDFTRLGVFLDHHASTLSFYKVSSNVLHHFHTIEIKPQLSEPVYAIIRIGDVDVPLHGSVRLL
uniref:Tx alpha-subunit n=1 Tax=Sebastapistes strongia TaxID=991004 RepID=A0A068BIV4_9TELE|nr:Tx alpha-subunit [Sebastapistes strongia]AIC84045.1 Tx alpha-subunit [Sebastapistes strongia]